MHVGHLQLVEQLAAELGEGGEVGTFQAQFGALAPGDDLAPLLLVDRIAVAAAEADADRLDRAGAGHGTIERVGDLRCQLGRVAELCLAVEGDVHAVVGNLTIDLGTQADLVVARWLLGVTWQAVQAAAEDEQGGETGQVAHWGLLSGWTLPGKDSRQSRIGLGVGTRVPWRAGALALLGGPASGRRFGSAGGPAARIRRESRLLQVWGWACSCGRPDLGAKLFGSVGGPEAASAARICRSRRAGAVVILSPVSGIPHASACSVTFRQSAEPRPAGVDPSARAGRPGRLGRFCLAVRQA
ncbi:hypothetical protein D3C80_1193790 [compost metagenome]